MATSFVLQSIMPAKPSHTNWIARALMAARQWRANRSYNRLSISQQAEVQQAWCTAIEENDFPALSNLLSSASSPTGVLLAAALQARVLDNCVAANNIPAFQMLAQSLHLTTWDLVETIRQSIRYNSHNLFHHLMEHHATEITDDQWIDLLKTAILHHSPSTSLIWDQIKDVQSVDTSGLLELAAFRQDTDAVKILLPYCDPKENNSIALQWACEFEQQEMFDCLLPVSDVEAAYKAIILMNTNQEDAGDFGLFNTAEDQSVRPSNAKWLAAHLSRQQMCDEVSSIQSSKATAPKRRM